MDRDSARNNGTVPFGIAEAFILVHRRDFTCARAWRLTIRSFADGSLSNRRRIRNTTAHPDHGGLVYIELHRDGRQPMG
jgi:hypothetical protein